MFKKILWCSSKSRKSAYALGSDFTGSRYFTGLGNALRKIHNLTNVIPALKADWFVMVQKLWNDLGDDFR